GTKVPRGPGTDLWQGADSWGTARRTKSRNGGVCGACGASASRKSTSRNRVPAAQPFTMASMPQVVYLFCLACADPMTSIFLRIPAAIVFGTVLLASPTIAPAQNIAPQSPYGGVTIQEIIARVNDQIITRSDYDRALAEVDQEARQRGETMQQMSDEHRDMLRNLVDQQ